MDDIKWENFKLTKKKVLFWIWVELFIGIVFCALCWNNLKVKNYIEPSIKVIGELSQYNVVGLNACNLEDNGKVNKLGDDAQIILNGDNVYSGNLIEVQFGNILENNIDAQLFVDYGEGFSENNSFWTTWEAGQDTISFIIDNRPFSSIRLDIDGDYILKSIRICEYKEGYYEEENSQGSNLIIAIVITSFITLLLYLLDSKFLVSDKIVNYLVNHLKLIIWMSIYLVISIILKLLLPVNGFVFVFVWGLVTIVLGFVSQWKNIEKSPENLFLLLLLVIGTVMILDQPFGHHCWDLDSHYKWVLASTSLGDKVITDADRCVVYNDANFLMLPENREQNVEKISVMNEMKEYSLCEFETSFSLPHMCNGIAVAILRMFGISFYWIFTLGKFPTLLIYACCCYFGMKKLKSGKMIFAVVAMLPANIFLASNYTYDYWVTCFSMLGMAYFIGICQEKKADVKDVVIMCVAFAVACIPKAIYVPLLLIPLFLPTQIIEDKKKYYKICVGVLLLCLAFLAFKSIGVVSGPGDLRGGDVNPRAQIAYILHNPIEYTKTLITFLKSYLSVRGMTSWMTFFAYLGTGEYSGIVKLLLLVVCLFDKNEFDIKAYSIWSRVYIVIMYIGMAGLMATALYIAFTPVGLNQIGGCQPRYIIPLVYPLSAIVFGGGIRTLIRKNINTIYYKLLYTVTFVIMVSVSYYDIYSLMYLRVR